MSSAWDTSAHERRPSTGALRPSSTLSTAEWEQLVPLLDVKRWSESSSIRELVKERLPATSAAVPSARSWCRCAFIIRSSADRAPVVFLSVESWSVSCKLSTNSKFSSKASRGELHDRQRNPRTNASSNFLFFSLKPVPQFVIPPINVAPPSTPSSTIRRESSAEPSPKRLRLDEEPSSIHHEAQHSVMINNVINALESARPSPTEVM